MRIWLIKAGEPLPIDGNGERLMRTGLLAEALLSRGHEVVWWTSSFVHRHKIFRCHTDKYVDVSRKYRIWMLHGMPYKKNVSIHRIINHHTLARKFAYYSREADKPDIILCSFPTIEFASVATRYGIKNKIPVVLDFRDLWPDIFFNGVPSWLRTIIYPVLWPMFRSVRKSCERARSICGITPQFVEKGIGYAGRSVSIYDRCFPLAYRKKEPDNTAIVRAEKFWRGLGIFPNCGKYFICYIGSLSSRMELRSFIETACTVNSKRNDSVFIICGAGEEFENCKAWAQGDRNIVFSGWVGQAEIWTLMKMAHIGVIPYPSTEDFMTSIPNKVVEYLAGGLAIISSIKGVLQEILTRHKCGITYENNNSLQLASIINGLLEHPERITVMAQNARLLFKDRFMAERVYEEMSEFLEILAEEHFN